MKEWFSSGVLNNGMITEWTVHQTMCTISLEERSCRQNWENFERWGRYNIAEKRTVWRAWILAPGANVKDLMKYINVTSVTINFQRQICSIYIFRSPKLIQRRERKTNLQSPSYVSDQMFSAHTTKRCHCCMRNLCCLFQLDIALSLCKNKDEGVMALVLSILPPSHPIKYSKVPTYIPFASCYSQTSSGSHPLAFHHLLPSPFKPGHLLTRPSHKSTKCTSVWKHSLWRFFHLKWPPCLSKSHP